MNSSFKVYDFKNSCLIRISMKIIQERIFANNKGIANSARAVEYTHFFSLEGLKTPNECLGYDTKESDNEVPVMLYPFIAIAPHSYPLVKYN